MGSSFNGALSVLQSGPRMGGRLFRPDQQGPLLGGNVLKQENRNGKLRTGIGVRQDIEQDD